MESPRESAESTRPSELHWDQELAGLLAELSSAQDELLAVLADKRQLLVEGNLAGLGSVQQREAELVERLQRCHDRRGDLLAWATEDGMPAASLRALSANLSEAERRELEPQFRQATARQRLLQHQSLANWVVVQRTLIYLSHVLEIIATGGRTQPTYGKDTPPNQSGSLVDQAA